MDPTDRQRDTELEGFLFLWAKGKAQYHEELPAFHEYH